MPIKHPANLVCRPVAGRISIGFLFFMLVLFISSCASDGTVPSNSNLSLASPPVGSSVVVETTPSVATAMSLEPPTLTTIPTILIESAQLSEDASMPVLSSPTLMPPTTLEQPVPTPAPAAPSFEPVTLSASPAATAQEAAIYDEVTIGRSGRGLPLVAHQFGNGQRHIIIVGGIHGGYEWNTILLAYRAIDYFQTYSATVPESITLTIIPSANPDGQELVTGKVGPFSLADLAEDTIPGRFNANNVDLNRNWDCQWTPTAIWRGNEVSGGTTPFSEPETVVLRDFLLQQRPDAVIFLHSAADGVFASGCPNTHQPSMELAQTYGSAAGYPVYERFSAYEVTGDAGDWLTTQGITAISVELIDHQDLDLEKNLAGMLAVLEHYK